MANDHVKLSKNLLRMKVSDARQALWLALAPVAQKLAALRDFVQFMQRGLDAETKQQLEEDQKRIISDEHWYLDLPELKAKE